MQKAGNVSDERSKDVELSSHATPAFVYVLIGQILLAPASGEVLRQEAEAAHLSLYVNS